MSAPDDAAPGPRASHVVIAVTGALFAVGVLLLVVAVWVDLPGPLSAYGDPRAGWPVGVQVLLGGTALATWRWVSRRSPRPFAVVFLALGLVTVLALAIPSYARCPDAGLSTGWSVVSRVVGLVSNNFVDSMFAQPGCHTGGTPLALQFARLVQLFVLLVAATSAVTALLRTQVDRVSVRLARRVALVVGADTSSSALLPALAAGAGRATLAVLTPDPAAPWLWRARASGWKVVVGEPDNAALLRTQLTRPGSRNALQSLTVLAPDSTAAQRLFATAEEAVEGTRSDGPVRVLLRMDDAWQAEDWRRRYLGRTAEWIVDTISVNEVTARLLVEDLLARGVDAILVAGHSDLTFAVVAEVAQQARERAVLGVGARVPSVVLIGPSAPGVLEEHELAQARFGNEVTIEVSVRADTPLLTVVEEAVETRLAPALLFSGEPHGPDQRLAARLGSTHPGLHVYSHRAEVTGLGLEPLMAEVRAFGLTLDAGGGRPVDSWERIARLVHERFVRAFPDPTRASRRPWDDGLPRFYRDSTVRQVLTVLASAVAVGRSWGASDVAATPVTEEQLDRMAQTEQASWRAHLEDSGWRWAATRDDEAQTHPDLLPWADLPEESRDKTREGVRNTLALLTTLGYRSFDDPAAGWQRFRRHGEVHAVRRVEPWAWTTASGEELHGSAGDWQVTDLDGTSGGGSATSSSRSVAAAVFEQTHEHIEGDRWRRTGEVDARPAVPGEVVTTLEGSTVARPDQWVLRGIAGEEWLISARRLGETYQPVE